ncbi:P1 family peptidase [Parvibacter caecicola]|uniref:P1 family peptidase n=1 Tax=Parvibacter caecicola TaxID=747645 RepID=UPI001F472D8B|nr:P1 family peptidase [Parvibacter caecicola]
MTSASIFAPATKADLPAFGVGSAELASRGTGCTFVVAPEGAVCGVDVRGAAPATRETDLLRPENTVQQVQGVMLAGGSAFGLEAACGAMDELAARGTGFHLMDACVPIVPGACLFDLPVGQFAYPRKEQGAEACVNALENLASGEEPQQGNIGAGTGATVAKMLGPAHAVKSGLGWHAVAMGPVVVGALVAVNAAGCVYAPDGALLAGMRMDDGTMLDAASALPLAAQAAADEAAGAAEEGPCANTTIGVVLTNAQLTKPQAHRLAVTTHDAYARSIKPVHTSHDGDCIFAMASGEVPADPDLLAMMACEAMQQAIANAITHATAAYGFAAVG